MNIKTETLIQFAQKTETDFLQNNIEQYVSHYTDIADVEIMALTAIWLNNYSREEGVSYAEMLYLMFEQYGSPKQYVLNKGQNWTRLQYDYDHITPHHTWHDWWLLMGRLYKIYSTGTSIGEIVAKRLSETKPTDKRKAILSILTEMFSGIKQMPPDTDFIPNKFCRFVMIMVRPRPIDSGVWSDTFPKVFSPKVCYIPLSSELLSTISASVIFTEPTMSYEFADKLYELFNAVFPNDPARGYFSLLELKNNLPIK